MQRYGWSSICNAPITSPTHSSAYTGCGSQRIQYKVAVLKMRYNLQSSSRYRTAIPETTHSCCWHRWSTSTPLCQHQSPGRTSFRIFHHRRPTFSGCRLTDVELSARNSRFGINFAVVPAPIENLPIWTILYSLTRSNIRYFGYSNPVCLFVCLFDWLQHIHSNKIVCQQTLFFNYCKSLLRFNK